MSEQRGQGSASLQHLVADLLAQLEGTAVVECELRAGEHRVFVRRSLLAVPAPSVPPDPAEAIPAGWKGIAAPLSGIFYMAESPNSPPFVTPGSGVAMGQVVGLIESMKMFNPVESEVDGVVRTIVAADAAVVEKGQVLMYIEPRGDLA
jgi:acetyl-CoA carboxylase biotin carboxyl carrier protein